MQTRVLVGCECSQVLCKAFRSLGYTAFSCDLEDCYGGHPEWHIKGDLFTVVNPSDFDLAILHPPCTYLSRINNVRYGNGVPVRMLQDLINAQDFFYHCIEYPTPFVAVENPIPHPLAALPRYSFLLQPYEFGHPYSKATCFWLRNLPCLLPTLHVLKHSSWVFSPRGYSLDKLGRSTKTRKRQETFEGVAAAIASQWGDYVERRLYVDPA